MYGAIFAVLLTITDAQKPRVRPDLCAERQGILTLPQTRGERFAEQRCEEEKKEKEN